MNTKESVRLWGSVVWQHSLTQAYNRFFFFFDGKGQDEEEEIHQIVMHLDKDHKGTLGQRIFGQRSAVLGEMPWPLLHHLAKLPRRSPCKQCDFSYHHLARSLAEGFSKQEMDLKMSHS